MIFKRNISSIKREGNIVRKTILFDENYYRTEAELLAKDDAALHYCTFGWKNGLNPSHFFDTQFYISAYADVRAAKINPLVHYLKNGAAELRRPIAEFDPELFDAAHSAHQTDGRTSAEICISIYKSYDWGINADCTQENSAAPMFPKRQGGQIEESSMVRADDKSLKISKLRQQAFDKFQKYFDQSYYLSHNKDVADSKIDPYIHFTQFGQFEDRDPSPHFDTHYYKNSVERCDDDDINIVDHYIAIGESQGRFVHNSEQICLEIQTNAADYTECGLTICVHVHCFYPDMIREIIPGFKNFPPNTLFVITVVTEADRTYIHKAVCRHLPKCRLEVRKVPNTGRDIAPFLIGCRDIWSAYDLVLHIHTKQSLHVGWGNDWRAYLYDQIMGSRDTVNSVLKLFSDEKNLGCVYPSNYYRIKKFITQESNEEIIQCLINSAGFVGASAKQIDFPAGSMAWYRSAAISNLSNVITDLNQFEEEMNQQDLTIAHALERVIPLYVRLSGYRVRNYTTKQRSYIQPCADLPAKEDSGERKGSRWQRDSPRIAREKPLPVAPLTRLFNSNCLNIHWIVPAFALSGAGGHMTIFRIIRYMEKFGHRQTIWFQSPAAFVDQESAKYRVRQWYQPIGDAVHVRFLPDDMRQISGDVIIATDCWTAFPASQVTNVKERFYLIQDFEPSFHAVGDLHLLAEQTYKFGFSNLCAGTWLTQIMSDRGLWARSWELCADHSIYFPKNAEAMPRNKPIKIAFYARRYTPRRAVALGFAAFELLKERGFSFQVELFGEENLEIDYEFPYIQHGILNPSQLADLYHACDIGLVFSATNYSLIPLEMMACGLPVVELCGDSTRAIFNNDEVTFAEATPYSVADAVLDLASNRERASLQRRRGFDFVAGTSWEHSARSIETAIKDRLEELNYESIDTKKLFSPYKIENLTASVIIPTYNAGPSFDRVLRAVLGQKCNFKYDVIVVDSSSQDGTIELVSGYKSKGVQLEVINNGDFQHGRTRNFGISISRGKYVALLTQDACPKDDNWLQQLVNGFSRGSRVAGVFGRHEAYHEHGLFSDRDVSDVFSNLELLPDVYDLDVGLPRYIYPGGLKWRMLMHLYSDNNSAMSREAWKILPYPEIEWGEDQVWADEALRLGFQKVYAADAVVYHSHSFDSRQQYKVAFTEGKFWGCYFGIDLADIGNSLENSNSRDRSFAIMNRLTNNDLTLRLGQNASLIAGRRDGYKSSALTHSEGSY